VVKESTTHIVREATIRGANLREIITFEPERKGTFFRATGPCEGAIIDELLEDGNGALQLRLYCYLGLRGKTSDGPEEQAEQAQFDSDKDYRSALLSTLRHTHELFAEGYGSDVHPRRQEPCGTARCRAGEGAGGIMAMTSAYSNLLPPSPARLNGQYNAPTTFD